MASVELTVSYVYLVSPTESACTALIDLLILC